VHHRVKQVSIGCSNTDQANTRRSTTARIRTMQFGISFNRSTLTKSKPFCTASTNTYCASCRGTSRYRNRMYTGRNLYSERFIHTHMVRKQTHGDIRMMIASSMPTAASMMNGYSGIYSKRRPGRASIISLTSYQHMDHSRTSRRTEDTAH